MPSWKRESRTLPNSPGILKSFLFAARPRTWIASLSPVCIAGAFAISSGTWKGWIWGSALAFALLIQIGTNYANDAFDFLKGADTTDRLGPPRAAQQGWLSVRALLVATAVSLVGALFLAFFLIGHLELLQGPGWWILAIVCAACAILYTGGPKPLAYLGLGEIFAFVFFGPLPTYATYFAQAGTLSNEILLYGLSPGFFSAALLIANNLRDEESDRKAGKNTLIVRWGRTFGIWEYGICLTAALLLSFPYGWLLLPWIWQNIRRGCKLEETAKLFTLYTLCTSIGIAFRHAPLG